MTTSYAVRAYNPATASENKIHDDDVARTYGFQGGLVPGVTVYAYMTHPVVETFGRPWLEHGTMAARFVRPCYDGDEVQRVIHLRTMHLGPEELLVAAKVEIDVPSVADLARAIDAAEARVRAAVPIARVIYLEPDVYRSDPVMDR